MIIKTIANDVSDRINQTFGGNIVGVYLFGSLVLGDFDENFSDIDLMIVLKRDINKSEFEKIKDLQKYISEKYSRFGTDGIEMIFVSTETIKSYLVKETFLTAVAPGNPLETVVCKPEFLIYFYIVKNYGKTILGTPKEEVFPIISETDFVNMSNKVATENIPYWKEACKKTLHEQFYSVITLCRALYIKENKTYPSKLEAKNWTKNKYPNFKDIIEYAWNQRGKWKETDEPTDEHKHKEIIEFFGFAKSKLSDLVIENIKENIVSNENVLEILKYSHWNPTKEKLSKLAEKYHKDKGILPFASFDENKISGIIVVQKIEGRTYEIIDIAVDKHHRGQGVASKLIDYIIKNLGIKTLFAETDDDAVGFYEKYGFKTEIIKNKEYTRYKCTLSL